MSYSNISPLRISFLGFRESFPTSMTWLSTVAPATAQNSTMQVTECWTHCEASEVPICHGPMLVPVEDCWNNEAHTHIIVLVDT